MAGSKKSGPRALALWVVLIAVMLAIWQFMQPAAPVGSASAPATTFDLSSIVGLVLPIVALLALVGGARRWNATMTAHVAALARAQARLDDGRLDEAAAALAAPSRSSVTLYRRRALAMRAELACVRGDRGEALARLDEAIALPKGRLAAAADRAAIGDATAARALVRASAGDEAGARADAASAKRIGRLSGTAKIDVLLADALLHERRGDRAALRALLGEHGDLLRTSSNRRQRAFFRALDAMSGDASASVYRRAGVASSAASAQLDAYVAFMCPAAARFAGAPAASTAAPAEAPPLEPASAAARKSVEGLRSARGPRQSTKRLVLWIFLVVIFLGVWQFLDTGASTMAIWAVGAIAIGAAATWAAFAQRRAAREQGRVEDAIAAYESGDLDGATRALATLPKAPWAQVQAANYQAAIALAEGDFEGAAAATEVALRALARAHGGKVPEPAAPGSGDVAGWDYGRVLAGQRALALAGLGRLDEARAELAWARGFPNLLTQLLVDVTAALRDGDVEHAATLLEAVREPAMTTADEVLFEIIRFVAHPSRRPEIDVRWIDAELARAPRLRRRTERFAPGLLARFERERETASTA